MTTAIRRFCFRASVLACLVGFGLPLLSQEEGEWEEIEELNLFETEGTCYYQMIRERNTVTNAEREGRKMISCEMKKCEDEEEDAGAPSSGGASSSGTTGDSSGANQGGCSSCSAGLEPWNLYTDASLFREGFRLTGQDLETGDLIYSPDPVSDVWRDPWGNQVQNDGWQGTPEQMARQLAPALSLGRSSYGSGFGRIAITPDILTQGVDAPLTVQDISTVLPATITNVQEIMTQGVDAQTSLPIRQYTSPDAVVVVREMEDGSLRMLSFRSSDTVEVPGEDLRQLPPDDQAVTDLTIVRTLLNSSIPVLSVTGSYLGQHYETQTQIEHAGNGLTSVKVVNGTRVEAVDTTDPNDAEVRIRGLTQSMRDPVTQAWVEVSERFVRSRTLINGQEVVMSEEITGANNDPIITSYTYDEREFVNTVHNKAYGRLLTRVNPDGSWIRYEYHPDGRLWRTFSPWLDGPATPDLATTVNCRMEVISNTPSTIQNDEAEQKRETFILGVLMASESSIFEKTAGGFIVSEISSHRRLNGAGAVETYERISKKEYLLLPDGKKRLIRSISPSGTRTRYDEVVGNLAANGTFTPAAEGSHRAYYTWQHLPESETAEEGHTQRSIRYVDQAGQTVREERAFATNSAPYLTATYHTHDGSLYVYDAEGRLSERRLLDGTIQDSYARAPIPDGSGGYLGTNVTHTNAEGTKVVTQLNHKGEVSAVKRLPISASHSWWYTGNYVNNSSSTFSVSAAVPARLESSGITAHAQIPGTTLVTSTVSNDSWPLLSFAKYQVIDAAGRTMQTIQPGRAVTYAYALGGRQVTQTFPGGTTQVSTRHLDGQFHSHTGTAVVPEHHGYEIHADGTLTETTWTGTANSPRWRKVLRDFNGTVLKESSPRPDDPTQAVTVAYYHDNEGRVTRVSRPGFADQLTTYRTDGSLYRRGLDLDGSATLDLYSNDAITESDSFLETYMGYLAGQMAVLTRQVSTETTFTENSGLPYVTALKRTVKRDVGRGAAGLTTITEQDGTTATMTTTPNRYTGVTSRVTSRPGYSDVREFSAAGQSVIRYDPGVGKVSTTSYAADGTLSSRTSRDLDGQRVETISYTYDAATGQPSRESRDGILHSSFDYYPNTHVSAGRVQTITSAVTTGVTTLEYNARGQETRRSGTGSYSIERSYTAYGEPETLITRRSSGGVASTTTWDYQDETGLLLSKADSASQATSYTYDQSGRVKTRTNARSIVTTYTYDLAGRLTHTDYSDSTPDVTHAYDRAGRLITATDGSGTRQLSYLGAMLGGQESRIIWGENSPLWRWEFSRFKSTSYRSWNVSQTGVGTQSQVEETLSSGRLARVKFAELSSRTVEFNLNKWYNEGAEDGLVYEAANGKYLTSYIEEDLFSNTTSIAWAHSNDPYGHQLWNGTAFMMLDSDRLHPGIPMREQRIWRSGGGLTPLSDPGLDVPQELKVSYNSRGEVSHTTRIRGALGGGWGVDGPLLPGGSQRWTYDSIGNLTQSSVSKLTQSSGSNLFVTLAQANANTEARQNTAYTPNALNQYTTITRENPLLRLIQGAASTQSTVTVSLLQGITPTQLTVARVAAGKEPFVAEAAVNLTGGPKWQKVRVEATRSGVGPNNGPLTATREGWMLFPPQDEMLTYDNDGNLYSDARWTYTWDAENRLKSMEEKVIAGDGPARTRLEFTYDSQHRRVRKVVKSFSATTNSFVLTKDRRFIYDGWNLVAELDASPVQPGGSATSLELLRSYLWGNDLSGTPQGAGGVGGLLMIQERDLRAKRGGLTAQAPAVYVPIYDFNGNVVNYVEINRGEGITHTFDYDAFGRELTHDTLIPSGDTSPPESLPIKFSTKYHDEETGLAYYGYRYYNPEMGRWVNRDPIGEKGGINLYGMVGNDAVNKWDYLGLSVVGTFASPQEAEQYGAMLSAYRTFQQGSNSKWQQNDEWGGAVCQCKCTGEIGIIDPIQGFSMSVRIRDCPEGWETVGTFHSHGLGKGTSPYPQDMSNVDDKGISVSVVMASANFGNTYQGDPNDKENLSRVTRFPVPPNFTPRTDLKSLKCEKPKQ